MVIPLRESTDQLMRPSIKQLETASSQPVKQAPAAFATKRSSRPRRRHRPRSSRTEEAGAILSLGAIGRTRRLIMAALRVWELKNGIHDSRLARLGEREQISVACD